MAEVSSHTHGKQAPRSPLSEILADARLDADGNITFQIFDIQWKLIVSVRLRPGQRISEKEVAAVLRASKTPVREALIRLDEINLVKIVLQSGTYVTLILVSRYTIACFIRLQLEIGAVRAAASVPDPLHRVEDLSESLDRQSKSQADDNHAAFFELDQAFHCQIFYFPAMGMFGRRRGAHSSTSIAPALFELSTASCAEGR